MRRIVNTVGASYFYFEKFQGTAAAWPRVRFPKCEPLTEEFAKRVAQLPRLVAEKADTAWKWFFTDAVNSRRDLPSPAGVAAFWSAVDQADVTGKMLLAGDEKTWRALIASFKDTDKYKNDLSKSMRDQYARHLRVIEEAWGRRSRARAHSAGDPAGHRHRVQGHPAGRPCLPEHADRPDQFTGSRAGIAMTIRPRRRRKPASRRRTSHGRRRRLTCG